MLTHNSPDLLQVPFEQMAIDLLDETPVLRSKIGTHAFVDEGQVVKLFEEVLRFLFLIHATNERLTPSLVVDRAWHEFILCTRLYHRFCDEHFGRYIHHHPGGDEDKNHQQFHLTLQMYNASIGKPPKQFWGEISEETVVKSQCGTCESIIEK